MYKKRWIISILVLLMISACKKAELPMSTLMVEVEDHILWKIHDYLDGEVKGWVFLTNDSGERAGPIAISNNGVFELEGSASLLSGAFDLHLLVQATIIGAETFYEYAGTTYTELSGPKVKLKTYAWPTSIGSVDIKLDATRNYQAVKVSSPVGQSGCNQLIRPNLDCYEHQISLGQEDETIFVAALEQDSSNWHYGLIDGIYPDWIVELKDMHLPHREAARQLDFGAEADRWTFRLFGIRANQRFNIHKFEYEEENAQTVSILLPTRHFEHFESTIGNYDVANGIDHSIRVIGEPLTQYIPATAEWEVQMLDKNVVQVINLASGYTHFETTLELDELSGDTHTNARWIFHGDGKSPRVIPEIPAEIYDQLPLSLKGLNFQWSQTRGTKDSRFRNYQDYIVERMNTEEPLLITDFSEEVRIETIRKWKR